MIGNAEPVSLPALAAELENDPQVNVLDVRPTLLVVEMSEERRKQLKARFPQLRVEEDSLLQPSDEDGPLQPS